jgi:hypothetical protein
MATIIGPDGKTSEITAPSKPQQIEALTGVSLDWKTLAPDGSVWCGLRIERTGTPRNTHAEKLFHARGGAPTTLYGVILVLSKEEHRIFLGKPEELVPISGRTYDVKESLKAIGAKWDPDRRVWKIQPSKLAEAQEIVRKGPSAAPIPVKQPPLQPIVTFPALPALAPPMTFPVLGPKRKPKGNQRVVKGGNEMRTVDSTQANVENFFENLGFRCSRKVREPRRIRPA